METISSPLIQIPRPNTCPQCGYSWQGLPQIGNCPECATPFGGDNIILYGWGMSGATAKSRGPIIFELVGAAFNLQLAFVSLWMLFFISRMFPTTSALSPVHVLPWWYLPMIYGSALFWSGGIAHSLYLRRLYRRTMPAPMQLRLSPAGYSIRGGLGRAKLRPWKPKLRFKIKRRLNGCHRIIISTIWFARRMETQTALSDSALDYIEARVGQWINPALSTINPPADDKK